MIELLLQIFKILLPNFIGEMFKNKPTVQEEIDRIKAEVDAKYEKVRNDKDPSEVADFINRIK